MERKHTCNKQVKIQLSKLMQSLNECCREANIEFDEGSWRESRSNLDELLSHHPVLGRSVYRLYGKKLQRTFPKGYRYYGGGTVVMRGVHLLLDTTNWCPLFRLQGFFGWGVCFVECTVQTEGNTGALLGLQFAREIVFRKTKFVSRENEIWPSGEIGDLPGTWLVNLKEGSSISFEECDFRNNHVQIRAFGRTSEALSSTTTAGSIERRVDKEDEPRAPHTEKNSDMLLPANTPAEHALERIALHGNRNVGRVHIVSETKELILRAGNRLEALCLPSSETTCLPSSVSLGLFEEIDPTCRDPLAHKDTFLKFRQLGTDTKDDALVRASTTQIDKIEHFLLTNDSVRLSNGLRRFADHLQRRAILEWGYRISNFNRSWLRCFGWLLLWHLGTSMLACWMVWPPLESNDVVSIPHAALAPNPLPGKNDTGASATSMGLRLDGYQGVDQPHWTCAGGGDRHAVVFAREISETINDR